MDDDDREILEHIEKYGCSVIHVAAEGELPPFTYSVGITKSSSSPEVVVIGLKRPMAHFVINEYNHRVQAGEAFVPGKRYAGFLEGFEVEVRNVDSSFYEEYFGYDLWLYKGPNFEVLQLVYPNTSGVWPWDAEASDWFKSWQPLLCSQGAA